MSAIRRASLRSIYDSRGRATVEATIETDGGRGVVGAPSGESTGAHEVRAFPDGGVPTALERFRDLLAAKLVGLDNDGATVDALLHEVDGTPDFGHVGGNVATALSVAAAIARAQEARKPLWELLQRPGVERGRFPAIVGNCMNGGRHAIGGPDLQEFIAFAPGPHPADAIRASIAVHTEIGDQLKKRFPGRALGRGDEGGWVAPLGNVEALELLTEACATVRDRTGAAVHPGIDLAASEFYRDGKYHYREKVVDDDGQVAFVGELVDTYGLRYLEDPIEEEGFDASARLTAAVGAKTLVVGDDLYTTSVPRLERGIAGRSTNAVLIKVNQVGTLTDTAATVDLARAHGLATVTSHRSGDLPEGWLAHAAVAFGSAGLKCGLLGGERVAKLNELLRLGAPSGDPPR